MLKFNPLPRLPLIVLLTTPTTAPLPSAKPPLPLLCTKLFHISTGTVPYGPALSPHPLLLASVHPVIWRAALASIPSAWLPTTMQLVSVPLPETPSIHVRRTHQYRSGGLRSNRMSCNSQNDIGV